MPGTARRAAARASATDADAGAGSRRRHASAALLLVALAPVLAGCWSDSSTEVTAVDLMSRVRDAERRPAGGAFEMAAQTLGGRSRSSVIVPPESRLTFSLPIPHRATVRFFAGLPQTGGDAAVAFRVGISDDRFYQTLMERTITSADTASRGWFALSADLTPFAGRKLSLFYRPDARRWRLVLGTHVVTGAPAAVYLAEPVITADVDSAREYFRRRSAR